MLPVNDCQREEIRFSQIFISFGEENDSIVIQNSQAQPDLKPVHRVLRRQRRHQRAGAVEPGHVDRPGRFEPQVVLADVAGEAWRAVTAENVVVLFARAAVVTGVGLT